MKRKIKSEKKKKKNKREDARVGRIQVKSDHLTNPSAQPHTRADSWVLHVSHLRSVMTSDLWARLSSVIPSPPCLPRRDLRHG
jgi:hypothetical protein